MSTNGRAPAANYSGTPEKVVGETSTRAHTTHGRDIRAARVRHWARHRLDELLDLRHEHVEMGEPTDWAAVHMTLGVPERDRIGRELARAGWCP